MCVQIWAADLGITLTHQYANFSITMKMFNSRFFNSTHFRCSCTWHQPAFV